MVAGGSPRPPEVDRPNTIVIVETWILVIGALTLLAALVVAVEPVTRWLRVWGPSRQPWRVYEGRDRDVLILKRQGRSCLFHEALMPHISTVQPITDAGGGDGIPMRNGQTLPLRIVRVAPGGGTLVVFWKDGTSSDKLHSWHYHVRG